MIYDASGRPLRRRTGYLGGLVPVKIDPDEAPGAVAYGGLIDFDSDEVPDEMREKRGAAKQKGMQ